MHTVTRAFATRFGYPLIVAWPIAITYIAIRLHLDAQPGIAGMLRGGGMVALGLGPVIAAIVWLSRAMPYRTDMRPTRDDVRNDALFVVAMWAINPVLKIALINPASSLATGLATMTGVSLWPQQWPLVAQLALAIVVADLGHYAFHRIAHETELGWRVHATHHQPRVLYWFNATRFHAFEIVLQNLFQAVPLVMLGCGREAFLLYGVATSVFGWLQHSNIDFKLGVLNRFISTPELHRWHHSTDVSEANQNYGAIVVLWDQLFGTYFWPRDRQYRGAYGIGAPSDFPSTFLAQQLSPFTWKRAARQAPGTETQPAPGVARTQ